MVTFSMYVPLGRDAYSPRPAGPAAPLLFLDCYCSAWNSVPMVGWRCLLCCTADGNVRYRNAESKLLVLPRVLSVLEASP